MTTRLSYIYGKLNDFKLCSNCYSFVFYEHDSCPICLQEPPSFIEDSEAVLTQLEEEYSFYHDEGYDDTFIDNIEIPV